MRKLLLKEIAEFMKKKESDIKSIDLLYLEVLILYKIHSDSEHYILNDLSILSKFKKDNNVNNINFESTALPYSVCNDYATLLIEKNLALSFD